MAERFTPRGKETEERHGRCAYRERHCGSVCLGRRNTRDMVADGEEEVDESEAKKGDMPQARQATAKAVIPPIQSSR